jgi:hypothetical protein
MACAAAVPAPKNNPTPGPTVGSPIAEFKHNSGVGHWTGLRGADHSRTNVPDRESTKAVQRIDVSGRVPGVDGYSNK